MGRFGNVGARVSDRQKEIIDQFREMKLLIKEIKALIIDLAVVRSIPVPPQYTWGFRYKEWPFDGFEGHESDCNCVLCKEVSK